MNALMPSSHARVGSVCIESPVFRQLHLSLHSLTTRAMATLPRRQRSQPYRAPYETSSTIDLTQSPAPTRMPACVDHPPPPPRHEMKIDTAQTPPIDFEAGAAGWRHNKRRRFGSKSTYSYVCGHARASDGLPCQGVPYVKCRALKRHRVAWSKCRQHIGEEERQQILRDVHDGAEPQEDAQ